MSAVADSALSVPWWVAATVAAAAFVTAVGVIWRKVVKPLLVPLVDGVVKIAQRIETVNEVPEKLNRLSHQVIDLATKVDRIDRRTQQLDPNGGTSMNDRVRRIDESIPPKET